MSHLTDKLRAKAMRKLESLIFPLFFSVVIVPNIEAHTVTVGYEAAGAGTVDFWYGTYHVNPGYTEGSFRLVGNGLDITSPFTQLVTTITRGNCSVTVRTSIFLLAGQMPENGERLLQKWLL